MIVNGTPKALGATGPPPSSVDPIIPIIPAQVKKKKSLKNIFDEEGADAFAKAVRQNGGLLITDTTWRDAHQSLLATRLRTIDMLNVAGPTSVALRNAYSLECWGGATFDDKSGNHFFMEVNPRVQVEHTVREEISGIDIVQSQILIASGKTLQELGLEQHLIPEPQGVAMQCRVTTEDPSQNFRPDTGTIDVFRMPGGMGIRLVDDGPGFPGAKITPHYDSPLLVKITAKARNRQDAAAKLVRALKEFRVRGVTTNKSFMLHVLQNEEFLTGYVDTGFIAANPQLLAP